MYEMKKGQETVCETKKKRDSEREREEKNVLDY